MSEQDEEIGTPEERAEIEAALDEGHDGEAERLLDTMLDRDDGASSMSDHRGLLEQAREQDLERRFGSWQDLDLNADGTEPDPIENIVTDAFALIGRLASALEQAAEARAERLTPFAEAFSVGRFSRHAGRGFTPWIVCVECRARMQTPDTQDIVDGEKPEPADFKHYPACITLAARAALGLAGGGEQG